MNTLRNFANSVFAHVSVKFRGTIYINGISRSCALKRYIICSYFKSVEFFSGAFAEHFVKIAHKVAKSKYFVDI